MKPLRLRIKAGTACLRLSLPRISAGGSRLPRGSKAGKLAPTLGYWLIISAVHINSMTIHDEPVLPHGGVKNSGWGRFNGNMGLDEFLVTKTVTWKD